MWYNIVSLLKRKWWYLILTILSSIYVFCNRTEVDKFDEFNAANIIFIIWIVLLLFPLFSEVHIFGFRFKKEVDKVRYEMKEDFNELRMQIMDLKISNTNANTTNVYGNSILPTEQKLKELLEEFFNEFKTKSEHLIKEKQPMKKDSKNETEMKSKTDMGISEESTYLFKVRLNIEKALSNICDKVNYEGPKSIVSMLKYLSMKEILDSTTVDLLIQINNIANRGVHGEIVSKEYIDFVKEVLPKLQHHLFEAYAQLQFYSCRRCGYSGYSKYENECPKCGLVSDEG